MSGYRSIIVSLALATTACGGTTPPQEPPEQTTRQRVITEAALLIGQKETHGPNRSPIIDAMNRLAGAPLGSPYCASFNAYVYTQANVPKTGWPLSAWSPSWVSRPTWTRAKSGPTPKAGDAFGIYFSRHKRIAHTGLVDQWGKTAVITIEANTSPTAAVGSAADRDGDGIFRKRRLISTIHSTRDWINDD